MSSNHDTSRALYKVRWLLLAGISVGALNRQFTATAFAIANDTVSQYFHVTNYQVDILSIGDTILAVIVCLLLSMFGRYVRLRAQCLIAISCSVIGNLLTTIAFRSRNLYICVVFGRLICGLATGILYTLPATFANKWFPPKEIATAFSISFSSFAIGGVVSSLLIPHLIPRDQTASALNEIVHAGSALCAVFAVITGVLTIIMIFFWIYARDNPSSPPSESEAFLSKSIDGTSSFRSVMLEGLDLLKTRQFLLITFGNFLSSSALVLFVVLMPSLMSETFPDISSSNIGYLNAAAFCSATISILFAGRILDTMKMYKTSSCVGTGLIIIFSVGIYVCHLKKGFVLLCVLYPMLFLSRSFAMTSFVEFLVEVTYPMDKTVVTSLFFAFYTLSFFVTTSVERLALSNCGASCATLVSIFGNILALGCLLFVKPDYKRSRANEQKRHTVVALTKMEDECQTGI